jgi:hypothetical protein
VNRPLEQLLSDPRPGFLDAIDTDPEAARFEFLEFCDAYLTVRPLPALRGVAGEAREGALEEIRLFFLKDELRELRAFLDTTAEFAPWFRSRAEHIARERQRRLASREHDVPAAAPSRSEEPPHPQPNAATVLDEVLARHDEPDRSILVAWLEGLPFRDLHARFGNGNDMESFRARYRHLRYSVENELERWPDLRDQDPRELWRALNREGAPPHAISWRQTLESTILTNEGISLFAWWIPLTGFACVHDALGDLPEATRNAGARDVVQGFLEASRANPPDARRLAAWFVGAKVLPAEHEPTSIHETLAARPDAAIGWVAIEEEPLLVLRTSVGTTLIAAAPLGESPRKRVRKRIDAWLAEEK